jgi:hypothetical protein
LRVLAEGRQVWQRRSGHRTCTADSARSKNHKLGSGIVHQADVWRDTDSKPVKGRFSQPDLYYTTDTLLLA